MYDWKNDFLWEYVVGDFFSGGWYFIRYCVFKVVCVVFIKVYGIVVFDYVYIFFLSGFKNSCSVFDCYYFYIVLRLFYYVLLYVIRFVLSRK